jgi:hypothetical protein
VRTDHAEKHYSECIDVENRPLPVITANGSTRLRRSIRFEFRDQRDDTLRAIKFYLNDFLPHKYLFGRSLLAFNGLTWKVEPNMRCTRADFVHKASYDPDALDVHEDVPYPTIGVARVTETPASAKTTSAELSFTRSDGMHIPPEDYEYRKGDQIVAHTLSIETGLQEDVIDIGPLPIEYAPKLKRLRAELEQQHAKTMADIGCIPNVEFEIKLKPGAHVPFIKPRKVSAEKQQIIDKLTLDLLEAGIIEESNSSCAAPVVLIKKPNGTWRMCKDYRATNKATVPIAPILPDTREVLSRMAGARYFSVFDIKAAFQHVPVAENSRYLTAFVARGRLFQYTRMPFGVVNGPAVFANIIAKIFFDLPQFAFFMDDCCAFSPTIDAHFRVLYEFMRRLRKNNIKLNGSKCRLFQKQVRFLSNIISAEGIRPHGDYIDKCLRIPRPKTPAEARSAIGYLQWIASHVPRLAHTLAPITDLLSKKSVYKWTARQETAWTNIQDVLKRLPTLAHRTLHDKCVLETDASDVAVGAVLMQRDAKTKQMRIIQFASRKFTTTERNWTTLERELFGVVWAITYWRQYLIGALFEVWTDHMNLIALFRTATSELSGRVYRWRLTLSQFSFEVHHIPGPLNAVADGLSRQMLLAIEPSMRAAPAANQPPPTPAATIVATECKLELTVAQLFDRDRVRTEGLKDESHAALLAVLRSGDRTSPAAVDALKHVSRADKIALRRHKYHIVDGLIMTDHDEVVIPEGLQYPMLQYFHAIAAHCGVTAQMRLMAGRVYWPKLINDLRDHIHECAPCQSARRGRESQAGLTQAFDVSEPDELVAVDIHGPLPLSSTADGEFRHVLSIQDMFSRLVFFIPIGDVRTVTILGAFED